MGEHYPRIRHYTRTDGEPWLFIRESVNITSSVYTFAEPASVTTTVYSPTLSRWRIQLGAKYIF